MPRFQNLKSDSLLGVLRPLTEKSPPPGQHSVAEKRDSWGKLISEVNRYAYGFSGTVRTIL